MTSTAGSTAPTNKPPRREEQSGPGTDQNAPGIGRYDPNTDQETTWRPQRWPERHTVRRFTTAERLVHRSTAILMLLCAATAACLYIGPLAQLVGRRPIMVFVHEWSGVLLPAPTLLGLLSPAFRADLRSLNRFAPYDRRWLNAVRRRLTDPCDRPAGKFNAGQKLYAGWIACAVLVMMSTGLLMWFTRLLPGVNRTSAIFVHDLLAYAVAVVLIGHLRQAYQDPEARRGMRTGRVDRVWARREHRMWLPDEEGPSRRSR